MNSYLHTVIQLTIVILGFVLFGFIHSLLANTTVKRWLFERKPYLKAVYRLMYNAVAVITLALWYFLAPFPEGIFYSVPAPWNILLRFLQILGITGFLLSLNQIDNRQFLGIRQLSDYLNEGKLPDRLDEFGEHELVVNGLYKYARHPLYTASIMILAFNPVMSYKLCIITILFSLYFYIGSIYEERNLVDIYGQKYRDYQINVPRFLPRPDFF